MMLLFFDYKYDYKKDLLNKKLRNLNQEIKKKMKIELFAIILFLQTFFVSQTSARVMNCKENNDCLKYGNNSRCVSGGCYNMG